MNLAANHDDVFRIFKEWECNGRGFPAPIGEKILKHIYDYEELEITFPGVPKGTKIKIPTWFLEMSKHFQQKLSSEQFQEELKNYEKPVKFSTKDVLKYRFKGWRLFGMGNDTIYFWGFWDLGEFSVRIGSVPDSKIAVNVSRRTGTPGALCRIIYVQMEAYTRTLRTAEEKMATDQGFLN